MVIKSFPVRALASDLWSTWEKIHQSNPELASPFFSPEFAKLVGSVREDTEVGVLSHQGHPLGFFPFHRRFLRVAEPLGGHLSDFQAVVALPEGKWLPEEVIRGCGLSGWDFDHVLASQESFAPFAELKLGSPFIDLADGFRGYEANRKAVGSKVVKHIDALARKLAREIGPMRFEYHSPEPALFEQMLRWKKCQYRRTGGSNAFAKPWTVDLLTKIFTTQTAGFAGVLSALWAGERLIAVHMGMRSRTVWHYWFPTYDPDFGRYSPGMLLVLEMIKAAQAHGLKRIDLGKGDADYKTRLMTGATPVLEGSVILSSPLRLARQSWRVAKTCLRASPLRWLLRYPVHAVRAWRAKRSFS